MLPEECTEKFDTILVGPAENFKEAIINNHKKLIGSYSTETFENTPFPDRGLLPAKSLFSKEMFKQYRL